MRKLVKYALNKLGCKAKFIIVEWKEKSPAAVIKQDGYYEIRVNKKLLKRHGKRRCLFHESVHIWQYETGRLVDVDDYCLWDGVKHNIYSEGEEYFWSPWEIEARGMEDALLWSAKKWKENTRKKTKKS